MAENYGQLCTEVYHFTKPVGYSINGDIEYYYSRLKNVNGPILEPGCGTGRMLIPLMEKGLQVDGIDQSQEMMELCNYYLRRKGLITNLGLGNWVSIRLPIRNYEAIILPTGTLMLVTDYEESIRALQNFYNHLAEGGRLIFDFFQPDFSTKIGEKVSTEYVIDEKNVIKCEKEVVEIDLEKKVMVTKIRYDKFKFKMHMQTEYQDFSLRWFDLEEMKQLLKEVGFKEIVVSANFEYGVEPMGQDQIITFEATK